MPDETPLDPTPHRLRRISFGVLRFVLLAYISILILMVAMETRLVYPGAYFGQSLHFQDANSDIDAVDVAVASDIRLPARLLERPNPQHYVLFLHGNGIRAAQLDHWTRRLSATLQATVLTAEYRGYEDDRTPSESGVIEDAEAAHDLLQKKYNVSADEIIIYGRSLGGGCAAAVASSRGAKVLILDRTFDAIWKVAASKYPFIPVRLLMRNRFDSATRLADYPGPIIQIHAAADSLIPIERGRALFDRLTTNQKVWIEVPAMGHNDRASDELMRRIADEVRRWTDQESGG